MTRLLIDPAVDFDDDGTGPVTLSATYLDPTPDHVDTFAVVDSSTWVDLEAPEVSSAWRLTVRRSGRILEERTVRWGPLAEVAWAALTDVDPDTLQPSATTTTAWEAVLAEVQAAVAAVQAGGGTVSNDSIAAYVSATGPTKAALDAGYDVLGAATAAQAFAVQRVNHTGAQSADTLTDGATVKAFLGTERTKLAGITPGATANRADTATDALLAAKADLVGGYVPTSQLPALALNTGVMVANRAAMLALTPAQVQPGDVAVDTSTGSTRGSYMLLGTDPSIQASWTLLNAPTDAVSTVNGQQGTVVLGAADVNADPAGAADTASTYARQRANHTGTQTAATISDLATVVPSLLPLNNYAATSDPTVTSDSAAGYVVGSRWVNTSTATAFECLSAAAGAAVWVRLTADVQVFTASGTWTKPAWCRTVTATAIGPGGGGGAGALTASATASSGGGGGGGGGVTTRTLAASVLPATVAVTTGPGGIGGGAQSTASTAGGGGSLSTANLSGFGNYALGQRGGGGQGGQIGAGSTAGASGGGATGGGTGATGANGGVGANAGSTNGGAAGGGAGGGVSTTPAAFAGGSGGGNTTAVVSGGALGAAGGTAGGTGGTVLAGAPFPGGGGGGGGSSITGNGGAGGAGGSYGAGGGGGGSALNGSTSGAGAAGGPGLVVVVSQ